MVLLLCPQPLLLLLLLLLPVGVAVTATLCRIRVSTPTLLPLPLTPPPPPPVAAVIARIAVLVPCPLSRDCGVPGRRKLTPPPPPPPPTELPPVTNTPVDARGVISAAIARARSTGTIGASRGRLMRRGAPPSSLVMLSLLLLAAAAASADTVTTLLQMGQTPCLASHSSTQLGGGVAKGEDKAETNRFAVIGWAKRRAVRARHRHAVAAHKGTVYIAVGPSYPCEAVTVRGVIRNRKKRVCL